MLLVPDTLPRNVWYLVIVHCFANLRLSERTFNLRESREILPFNGCSVPSTSAMLDMVNKLLRGNFHSIFLSRKEKSPSFRIFPKACYQVSLLISQRRQRLDQCSLSASTNSSLS